MSIFKQTLNLIERGRQGLNEGLSIGFPRLIYYVPGVQPGAIYLLGGVTGAGKSALAMSSFVHNPYEDWLKNKKEVIKLKIFIWSLEVAPDILLTKFVCRNIFRDYNKYVDVKYVLSRGKHRISDEIYQLVVAYTKYYEQFEDTVTVMGPDNPTGIRNTVLKYLMDNGKETTKKILIHDGSNTQEKEIPDKYIPNHPNTYVIVVVDHLNILKGERNFNKKQNIDKLVEYMVEMSNRYNITPVLVQQINRGVESVDRMKGHTSDILISDFKETGDTTDAAHFILALNYPWRWEIGRYRDYDTKALGDHARFLSILKNRDGDANVFTGLQFVGGVGMFKEIPKAKDMTPAHYSQIINLRKYYDTE